ncbi:hypothetical protein F4824DRAFT_512981 [Ustulina deusta]|nr:hypothetical protein F4824DRAFT_512981 [Ustulina deusta]
MENENGTLLARQVRRLIEQHPTSKALENVEESAKTAILKLGNPDYYADEAERTVPIPLEMQSKRSFESQYKNLKKEYPTLPDLKGKDKGKEKEEQEKRERERNKSNLLDQLRSIPVEELQDFIQDLGISSKGGTSRRGFRGTSVETTSSWNTRGSSADITDQTSGLWRKVRERLGEDTGYELASLSNISRENDCDFADVKFYLEYLLRQDPDLTNSELTDLAIEFIDDCPGSQAKFLKVLGEKDPQLKRGYERYYAPPRLLREAKEKRPWARNPQAYRDRLFESLPPDEEGWDQIMLTFDPDTKKRLVKGRITASVGQFLDVCLESLRNNDEERHYLALKSDYPQETRRFEDSHRGQLLTIKPQPKGGLKGRLKTDIKILNYSCADQPYPDVNPRMYFFGIDKKKKKILKAWARTTYCETKEFKGGLDDLNEQRKACGQKEITMMSRIHRRWPNRDTGSNSDSNSDFDSDVELGPSCAVGQADGIIKQIFEQPTRAAINYITTPAMYI